MIIRYDKFNAMKTTRLHLDKEVLPRGAALPISHFDCQDLTPAIPIDADGDQDRLISDDAGLPHPLIPGIEDKIGKGLRKSTFSKGRKAFVEPLIDRANCRRRERMATKLLGYRFDFTGGNALHIHLRKSGHQGPFTPLVPFK